jgi:hypothetical protein
MKIIIAILLAYYCNHFSSGNRIQCISEDDNDLVEQCLDDNTSDINFKCHSLNTLLVSITNDTKVYFCSAVFQLHEHLIIRDVQNVILIGYPSILTCNSSDAGLSVFNSENITISGITLVDCGVLHDI